MQYSAGLPQIKTTSKTQGFTLVELIVVLIILAILAVYAAPHLFAPRSAEARAIQVELSSALRLHQQKAMQDTQTENCYPISTSSTGISMHNCHSGSSFIETTGAQITFLSAGSPLPLPVEFNGLGCLGSCSDTPVEIHIQAATSAYICIHGQGLIQTSRCSE